MQKKNLIMLEIDKDGNREWYNENGLLHRDSGPAIKRNDGHKEYWINGIQYIEEEFNNVKDR